MGLPPGDTDPYFDSMTDEEWKVQIIMLNVRLLLEPHCLYMAMVQV